jgi:hypothetical protein
MIHLTYSRRATSSSPNDFEGERHFLNYMENQREDLKNAIAQAPRHRLDHLATFVETHGERLAHFLEGLVSYRKALRKFRFKQFFVGLLVAILCGGAATLGMLTYPIFNVDQRILFTAGGGVILAVLVFWMTVVMRFFQSGFHRNSLKDLDALTPLETQTRRDSWEAVRQLVYDYLKKTLGRFSLREVKQDFAVVCRVRDKGSKDVREALNELAAMTRNRPHPGKGLRPSEKDGRDPS